MTDLPTNAISECLNKSFGDQTDMLAKRQLAALKAKIADDAVTIDIYDRAAIGRCRQLFALKNDRNNWQTIAADLAETAYNYMIEARYFTGWDYETLNIKNTKLETSIIAYDNAIKALSPQSEGDMK